MCFLSWFDQCFDQLLRHLWPLTLDVWALCVQVIRKGEVSCCWICTTCKDNEYVQDEFTCKACELGWWPDNDLAGRRERKLWAHLLLFLWNSSVPFLYFLPRNQPTLIFHTLHVFAPSWHTFVLLPRQDATITNARIQTSSCSNFTAWHLLLLMLYITRSHDSALLALSTSTPLPPKVTLLTSLLPALCLVVPQWLFWQRFIELRGAFSSQV